MSLFEWNHVYYAIPVGIGAVALYMGLQHYRAPKWDPTLDTMTSMVRLCAPGRFRCAGRQVTETTGEERPGTGGLCVERAAGTCNERCVADGVSLGGIDAVFARSQLCDPPVSVASIVEDERSNLDLPVSKVGVCDADGFAPTDVGIHQCILRSASSPGATGAIVMTARCRSGIVPTTDKQPQLISREQAIAIWCRRDIDSPTRLGGPAPVVSAAPSASASSATASPAPSTAAAPGAPAPAALAPTPTASSSVGPTATVRLAASASALPALIPAPMASAH
jgi:hypothetical protein